MEIDSSTLQVPCSLDALERIEHWIGERVLDWEIPRSTEYALRLCCEESFTNVVRHGQAVAGGDDVHLEMCLTDNSICLLLIDRGRAFDPLEASAPVQPAGLEEAKIGGLGIHLMRQFSSRMTYGRSGNANVLSMMFDLPGKSPPSPTSGARAGHQGAESARLA